MKIILLDAGPKKASVVSTIRRHTSMNLAKIWLLVHETPIELPLPLPQSATTLEYVEALKADGAKISLETTVLEEAFKGVVLVGLNCKPCRDRFIFTLDEETRKRLPTKPSEEWACQPFQYQKNPPSDVYKIMTQQALKEIASVLSGIQEDKILLQITYVESL